MQRKYNDANNFKNTTEQGTFLATQACTDAYSAQSFFGVTDEMSIRFTETEKWKDLWFQDLPVYEKLLFTYLCDNCDIAGFWEINLPRACFDTKIPSTAIESVFRAIEKCYISDVKHIWLKKFLFYQKNLPLNPENNCHKGIIKLIKTHQSLKELVFTEINKQVKDNELGASEGLARGLGKGNSTSNSKGNGNLVNNENDKDCTEHPDNRVAEGYAKGSQRVGVGYNQNPRTLQEEEKDKDIIIQSPHSRSFSSNMFDNKSFTEKEVLDMAVFVGVSEKDAKDFFNHYDRTGWKLPSGLPIVKLDSALKVWRNNSHKFEEKTNITSKNNSVIEEFKRKEGLK